MTATAPGATPNLHMGFVGVTTGGSSIMRIFPRWAELLQLPTRVLVGHDLPLNAEPDDYRDLVASISADPQHLGALVTTHKLALFAAARQLFDELDELAAGFGEISCIYKRDGQLRGAAKDFITAQLAMEEFLPERHFTATGAEVLCLGAGGAGCALTHQLGARDDRPSRITCTDISIERLTHLHALHERAGLPAELVRYVHATSQSDTDALLAALPPASLVVNATGMGKDRPGSPVSGDAQFPRDCLVWELNYRGALDFLRQAESQSAHRGLTLVDGWRYFIHGWSQAVAEVFDIPMPPEQVQVLADAAAELR